MPLTFQTNQTNESRIQALALNSHSPYTVYPVHRTQKSNPTPENEQHEYRYA